MGVGHCTSRYRDGEDEAEFQRLKQENAVLKSLRDVEGVPEFLNDMLFHMWPYLSEYVRTFLTTILEPAVRSALGRLGSGFAFDPNHCHLGSQPLYFRKITAKKVTQHADGGDRDVLVLTAQIEWRGDVSLYMRLASVGIGIRSLRIAGVLIIELPQMLPRPPMFQGVRVYFIEPPSVDLDFQGATTVLNMGYLKAKLKDAITSQISSTIVVPYTQAVLLDPEADYFAVVGLRPEGVLTFTVSRAEGLKAMDRGGTSDPFVVVSCGAVERTSAAVKKTLSPTFAFTLSIPIWCSSEQLVRIKLYDEDLVSHDFLGSADIAVREMTTWGDEEQVLDLADDEGRRGGSGRVYVSAAWKPLGLNVEATSSDVPAFVFAGLCSVMRLPYDEDSVYFVVAHCTEVPEVAVTPETQTSAKLKLGRPSEDEAEDGERQLLRKLALLDKYGVDSKDKAEILGLRDVDLAGANGANRLRRARSGLAGGHGDLKFNHMFAYLLGSPSDAVLSFSLMSESPKGSETLGKVQFHVSELMPASSRTKKTWIATLPGTCISMKCSLQLRLPYVA